LHDRFDRDQKEALIRQLFHIKQTSTVLEYVECFSKLIDRLKAYSASTNPLFYTMRFIDGLRPDLKAMILVARPQTLDATICMALVQEEVGGQMGGQSSSWSGRVEWPTSRKFTPRTALPLPPPPPRPDKNAATPPVAATDAAPSANNSLAAVKAYRRALGLCYKCNSKWSKDHKCAPEILHAVEALWESLSSDEPLSPVADEPEPSEQVFLAISKSAAAGQSSARTIQLMGSIQDVPI
jgi:hypothetical protein